MTKRDLLKFKQVLEASAAEPVHGSQREAILIEGSADHLDRTLQASERELSVRRLEVVSSRRKEAKAALIRINQGVYGICQDCEEPISSKRLAAMPSAALCIRCQSARDCDAVYTPYSALAKAA